MPDAVRSLVLASRSPRRSQLLRAAGFDFLTDPADIDELEVEMQRRVNSEHWTPADVAKHLALEKARYVARRHPKSIVIGADTVVAVGRQLLGKPADRADARRIMLALSGTTHEVITGVALVCVESKLEAADAETTTVTMRELSEAELVKHLDSNNWVGKAGGYGLQDSDPFVTAISGSPSNVVGLPIERIVPMLEAVGVRPAR